MSLFVNIGSSSLQFPGWINFDKVPLPGVVVCDIRLGLPLSSDSVDVVTLSHCLEHIHPFKEAPAVLRDIKRVLKPGGVLRVAVPDLAVLTRAYLDPKSEGAVVLAESQKYLGDSLGVAYLTMPPALRFSVICFGNNSGAPAYDGHAVVHDVESLRWTLVEVAGFRDFAAVGTTESRHSELLKTYQDTGVAEEIVVEVSKP